MLPQVKAKVEDKQGYYRKNGRNCERPSSSRTLSFASSKCCNGSDDRVYEDSYLEWCGLSFFCFWEKFPTILIGFSHPINFPIPEGIEIKVEKQTTVHITGASKEQVGQVAAKIRNYRPPEPFLGKGIRYSDEKIRRKEGKSAGK